MRLAWRRAKKEEQEANSVAARAARMSKRVSSPLSSPSLQYPITPVDKAPYQSDIFSYERANFATFIPRSCSYSVGDGPRLDAWPQSEAAWLAAGMNGDGLNYNNTRGQIQSYNDATFHAPQSA